MKKSAIAIAIALLFCTGTAFASEDLKFGVEGGLVISKVDVDDAAQSLANKTGNTIYYTREKSAPSFRIYGAYPSSEKVDIEFGFLNSSSIDVDFSASGTTDTIKAGVEISGLDFGLKYKLAEKIYLKAGIHRYKIESSVVGQIGGYTFVSSSETGIGTYIGGGLQANEHVSIGFKYLSNIGGNSENSASYVYAGYQF